MPLNIRLPSTHPLDYQRANGNECFKISDVENFIRTKVPDSIWRQSCINLIKELPEGVWLGGGWFESIYRNVMPKDYDLWFKSEEKLWEFIDYINLFKPENSFFNEYSLVTNLDSSNFTHDQTRSQYPCITFKKEGYPPLQLICIKWFDNPVDLCDYFDFTVCQFIAGAEGLTRRTRSFRDVKLKRLVINYIDHCDNPHKLLDRTTRYIQKGYTPKPGFWKKVLTFLNKDPSFIQQEKEERGGTDISSAINRFAESAREILMQPQSAIVDEPPLYTYTDDNGFRLDGN